MLLQGTQGKTDCLSTSVLSAVWFLGGRGPCSSPANTLSDHHIPFRKRSEPDSTEYQRRTGTTYRGTCAEVYGTRVTLCPCSTVFWLIFMASALRERPVSPGKPRDGTAPRGALWDPALAALTCRQAPAHSNPPHSNLSAFPCSPPPRAGLYHCPQGPNSGRGSALTGATECFMTQVVVEVPCSDAPQALGLGEDLGHEAGIRV